MILVPGGKKCYCGKAGCADAYCAASALTDEEQEMTLEQFMEKWSRKIQRLWKNGITIWIIWLF